MSLSAPQRLVAIPKGLLGTLRLVPGRKFATVQLLQKWECSKSASCGGVSWGPLQAAPAGGTVIFVTTGTSRGFTARRAAALEEGQDCMVLSRRHLA